MAGAFKRSTDKARGKAGKWTAWWIDADGKQRSRVGYTDKGATLELARKMEMEAARIRDGLIPAAEIARREAERRPIAEHIAEYRANIMAKDGGEMYARQAASSLRRLLADAKVENLRSLTGDRIQAALARVRARRSPRTANFALVQVKAFARWLVTAKKLEASPVAHLKAYSQHVGRKRVRRALTAEEAARLIAIAAASPDTIRLRSGLGRYAELDGPTRAMLYRIALGTGYRVDEIRSLTPEAFRLDANPPIVVLGAEFTKDGKPAEQPIRRELVDLLGPWLRDKPPGQGVVDIPIASARMLRHDLDAAGIPFETSDGAVDFHALRATYITLLIRAGADIKTVQVLARHANALMTLALYAKSSEADRAKAVESLPSLDSNPSENSDT